MTMPREQALLNWVQQQLNDVQLSVHPLPGDASFRRYARIKSNNKAYMLMDAPPEQEDSYPFVAIDQWFDAHQVRVPHIVASDLKLGFILLEDFGDTLLSQVLNDDTVDSYYHQAIDQLLQLQQLPVNDAAMQLPAYDFDKLMQEMSLFDEWFVKQYLALDLSLDEQQLIQQTYQLLANTTLAQPQVVVHRDYHSRNLMVLENSSSSINNSSVENSVTLGNTTTLGIIDFQDAVIGAYSYDLASILRDAYVVWPKARVNQWMQYFWQQRSAQSTVATSTATFTVFEREFDFMAAQRHLKVLGIFIRLNLRDGKTGYMKDLPLVFDYLLDEVANYPELDAFSQFLQQRIQPAFLHKMLK